MKSIHWKQIPASKDFRINFPLSLYLLRQYIESERELNVLEEAGYLLCSLDWLDIRETEISWAKRTQKTQWNDWGETWRGLKRGCTICYCVLPTEKATLKRQRVPPAVIVTDLHNCWWASCTHSERDQGSVSRYGASLKQNHCIINDVFFLHFSLFGLSRHIKVLYRMNGLCRSAGGRSKKINKKKSIVWSSNIKTSDGSTQTWEGAD